MGKIVFGMAMSLDGFVNDRNGSVARLYPDLEGLRETEPLQAAIRDTGAVVMGRHSYDMAQGDFTGYEFQVPIFVVTHQSPAMAAKGENDRLKFHFVSDGLPSALAQARTAAGELDVTVIGGASIAQQCLREGLIDYFEVSIAPVLLGGGLRLFEPFSDPPVELEIVTVSDQAIGGTVIRYRVIKSTGHDELNYTN